ncbi:hypothetical protein CYMTET_4544 [Cymbomonas tetramitiformis]|uniref:RING-type domain-containing protein n=1 Tax=Cymbomonas tetramitiformis TaxID=36881 RepID=A0AAE0LKA8_9CHLO|nr:hypothetical protein CYMTET_4544 [Cymbomonas tetramitiformis]
MSHLTLSAPTTCFLYAHAYTHFHCTGCIYDEGLSLFAKDERLVELYEADGCKRRGTREWVGLMSSQHSVEELTKCRAFTVTRLACDADTSHEIVVDTTSPRPFRSTLTILKGSVDVYCVGDVTVVTKPFGSTTHGKRIDHFSSSVVYESCIQDNPSGIVHLVHLLKKRKVPVREAFEWLSRPKEKLSNKDNFLHRIALSSSSSSLWKHMSDLFHAYCGGDKKEAGNLINEWLQRLDSHGETPITVAVLAANADVVRCMIRTHPPLTKLETKDGDIDPRYMTGWSHEYKVVEDPKRSEAFQRRLIQRMLHEVVHERARRRHEVASQLLSDEVATSSRKKMLSRRGNRGAARASKRGAREATARTEEEAVGGAVETDDHSTRVNQPTADAPPLEGSRPGVPSTPPARSSGGDSETMPRAVPLCRSFANAVGCSTRANGEGRAGSSRASVATASTLAQAFSKHEPERDEREDALCVICCYEPQAVAVVPCGHVCFCLHCADKERVRACPICRVNVDSFLRLYRV